ncbi:MAG: hypothetical protein GY757_07635 [bacterium]|nr:hypothetical protein [bacterium]
MKETGRVFKSCLILIIVSGLLLSVNCKPKPKIYPGDEGFKKAVEYTAATAVYLGDKFQFESIGLIGDRPGYTYAKKAGKWKFSLRMWDSRYAGTTVRLYDAAGKVTRFYDVHMTDRIICRADYKTGNPGSFENVKYTLINVRPNYDYYLSSGSGNTTWYDGGKKQNITAKYKVNNMSISRLGYEDDEPRPERMRIPKSGELSITIAGITVRLIFDGKDTVEGTYMYEETPGTITIHLKPEKPAESE